MSLSALDHPIIYSARVTLVSEKHGRGKVLIVHSGEVALFAYSADGTRSVIQSVKEGEIVAFASFSKCSLAVMAAVTRVTSEVTLIEGEDFTKFLAKYPDAYSAFSESVSPAERETICPGEKKMQRRLPAEPVRNDYLLKAG